MDYIEKDDLLKLVPEAYHPYVVDRTPLIRFKDIEPFLDDTKRYINSEQVIGYNPFLPGIGNSDHLNSVGKSLSWPEVDTSWRDIKTDRDTILEVPIHVQKAIARNAFYMTLEECFLQAGLVNTCLSLHRESYTPGHPMEIYAPYRCLSPEEFMTCQRLYRYAWAHAKAGIIQEIQRKQPELFAFFTILNTEEPERRMNANQWEKLELMLLKKHKLKIEVIHGKQGTS